MTESGKLPTVALTTAKYLELRTGQPGPATPNPLDVTLEHLLTSLWPILDQAKRDSYSVENEYGGDNTADIDRIDEAQAVIRQLLNSQPVTVGILGSNLGRWSHVFPAEWRNKTGLLTEVRFIVDSGATVEGYRVIDADGRLLAEINHQVNFAATGAYTIGPNGIKSE